MKLFDLSGRVAVITGGNGGIGLGMAQGLAAAGATIVVAGRDQTKSAAAVAGLQAAGAQAAAVEVDVAREDSCHAMVRSAVEQFGRLDILINNAGINIRKPPQDYTLDEWNTVMTINLTGSFTCSQAAYPEMCRAGGGKIINIGSMVSIFGIPYAPAYTASKGGIVQLTKSLAIAWAKDNIQVNSILPGWIDTDLTRGGRKQVPGLHERVEARTPAARWGDPADFAGVTIFLASAASQFVTGTAIPVDGGYSVNG
jgi:2-dehydro-3-deoxy-D-gluconate 5-dehydrogenase